mmetsp:Transcript_38786/g.111385  ORF Transcript_38786/g.111385 Transcript_38786/m.111385 type:complete len:181 (+) Transcript_38786:152-694(+)
MPDAFDDGAFGLSYGGALDTDGLRIGGGGLPVFNGTAHTHKSLSDIGAEPLGPRFPDAVQIAVALLVLCTAFATGALLAARTSRSRACDHRELEREEVFEGLDGRSLSSHEAGYHASHRALMIQSWKLIGPCGPRVAPRPVLPPSRGMLDMDELWQEDEHGWEVEDDPSEPEVDLSAEPL